MILIDTEVPAAMLLGKVMKAAPAFNGSMTAAAPLTVALYPLHA